MLRRLPAVLPLTICGHPGVGQPRSASSCVCHNTATSLDQSKGDPSLIVYPSERRIITHKPVIVRMRRLSLTVWAVVIAAVVTSAQVSQADFDTERNVNNFPKLEAPPQGEHKVAVDAVPGMRRAENFRPTSPPRGSRPRPQINQPGSQRPTPNQNQNPGYGQGAAGECLIYTVEL